MIIALLDEAGLFVYASPEEAVKDIEPIDAESEIRALFDENAVPYRVRWIRPNRRFGFGVISSVEPGSYELMPAGPPDAAALARLLKEHLPHTVCAFAVKRQLEQLLVSLVDQ